MLLYSWPTCYVDKFIYDW